MTKTESRGSLERGKRTFWNQ